MTVDIYIKNASQLVAPIDTGFVSDSNSDLRGLLVLEDGAVAIREGSIVAIGKTTDLDKTVECDENTEVIFAHNKTVLPGFIDAHTHPVFAGTRENEFEMRVQGKSYQEIAEAGGGIRSSVRHLRDASREELIEAALPRLDRFLANGTTTIEAKSGYGLTVQDELKMLEVIKELNFNHPIELIPTLLGAHEIPDEYREKRNEYLDLICEEMIPQAAENELALFCDVFCEEGVFTIEEARRVLETGLKYGLQPKIHADQLTDGKGALLAAEVGAISADHLDYSNSDSIAAMAQKGVVPVLLPGAVFFLGLSRFAPAREMIAAGLPVALATDYNPGTCMSESLPLIMTIACIYMKMTPAETLLAATKNAALAIGCSQLYGNLNVGSQADCVVWDCPNYRHLTYHFGVELVEVVIKNGRVVWRRSSNEKND